MWLYLLIFIIATTLYYLFGTNQQKFRSATRKRVLYLTMLSMTLFVGFGDMLGGYDRYIYSYLFDSMVDQISMGDYSLVNSAVAFTFPKEFGYQIYNVIIGLITENRYIFILITTLIIYSLLCKSIKDYCNDYPFAVIVFLGLWFFFTFTYLRQVMGATIAWLGVRYVVKRDLKRFLLVWLIAWSFHNSAYIFLPLYWVPIQKLSKQRIMLVMAIAFVLGLTGGPTALFDAYGEVDQERAGSVSNETGFRVAYLVEAAFFLYLILSKYEEIPKRPLNIVLLNMSLIFCAILLFFIKNENGGRLSWYYLIGIISTVTYLCTHSRRNHRMANIIVIVCFFLYFRILTQWGSMLSPYKTFFTNGIRQDDKIESEYEYDSGYDHNKFYRPVFRFMDDR